MTARSESVERLRDFLAESFKASELEKFLKLKGYAEVAAAVKRDGGDATYVFNVIQELDRRQLIDAEFFDRLSQERPKKEARIRVLRKLWLPYVRPVPERPGGATSEGHREMTQGGPPAPQHRTSITPELYILRHGIAVDPETPGIPDDERPLTPKGRRRMHQVARGLRRLGLRLDRIVTSPLLRARETAEIVAAELDAIDRLETADVLRAGSDVQAIRNWLRERSEERLMIVGHNPGLSELIALLVLGNDGVPRAQVCDLKKGAIAALRPSAGSADRFEFVWSATPGLIRRLTGIGSRSRK